MRDAACDPVANPQTRSRAWYQGASSLAPTRKGAKQASTPAIGHCTWHTQQRLAIGHTMQRSFNRSALRKVNCTLVVMDVGNARQ